MSSLDDEVWPAYLERTRELAGQLLHADDPYDVGLQLMGDTIEVIITGEYEYAVSMYNLWGDLTDRMELKPAEGDLAKAEMVRAAREWLALDCRDSDAVKRYFDHWLHDILHHDRS
ncbi:hypothetical protein ABZ860_20350 [Microbispora sp. NPDC046973]|uniref:hypothetical protein n=1 Tax=Microbispora sp. NPDC046973 TaxID=3155022 RepID=UPI0033CCF28A